jgi:hypothetical protein
MLIKRSSYVLSLPDMADLPNRTTSQSTLSSLSSFHTGRRSSSFGSPKSQEQPSILSVPVIRLKTYLERECIVGFDEQSFWVAIEAKVKGLKQSFTNAGHYPILVKNVTMNIRECASSSINVVLGERRSFSLSTDQTMCILVNVRILNHYLQYQNIAEPDNGNCQMYTAFQELESTLGVAIIPILSIECTYEHSMLPGDNEVSIREICYVRKTTCHSAKSWHMDHVVNFEEESQRNQVHQRLIHTISTTLPIEDALKRLDYEFNGVKRTCACPAKLEAARQLLSLAKVTGPEGMSDQITCDRKDSFIELCMPLKARQAVDNTDAADPSARITSLNISGSKANGMIHSASFSCSSDHARQLWQQIRKVSKPRQRNLSAVDEISESEKSEILETMEELKQLALTNKRSIGADTLRSLAMDVNSASDKDYPLRLMSH